MVKSVASRMGEVHVYEAMYRYNPQDHEEDDDDSYILIEPGDVLEVMGKNLDGQPENPQVWLNGYNATRNLKGLFPGPYVKYLGIKGADGEVMDAPPVLPPIPPRPRSTSAQPSTSEMGHLDDSGDNAVFDTSHKYPVKKPKEEPPGVPHRLIDTYFLKPIICLTYKKTVKKWLDTNFNTLMADISDKAFAVPSVTDEPLLPNMSTTPRKKASVEKTVTPCKVTHSRIAMTTVTPKKETTPIKQTPNKKATPMKKTPNKTVPRFDESVKKVGGQEVTDFLHQKRETDSSNYRDKRVRKLEEDVQSMKEDIKSLRRKIRKLEDRKVGPMDEKKEGPLEEKKEGPLKEKKEGHLEEKKEGPLEDKKDETKTDAEIEKSIAHLSDDHTICRALCLTIFTKEELVNNSRTGKRTNKCSETPRPAINAVKFARLQGLVFKCTKFDKPKFVLKFENLQKSLRNKNMN